MNKPHDEEVESTPFEGDRPGAHPVDVLGELPVDGDPDADTQLMSDADLEPKAVEGDRFDAADDEGLEPDLEDEPDAPDLRPDHVERFAEADVDEEAEADDAEERVTARPSDGTGRTRRRTH